MSIYVKNILRFLLLVAIQVLLLNKISLRWWGIPISGAPPFTPYLYPLIILLLPTSTPTSALLFFSFITGLSIDAFMNTGGMHAAACLIMGFARKSILSAIIPNKLEDLKTTTPSKKIMGINAFLLYSIVLLCIHHTCFYILEIWSFNSIGYLFIKILMTLITSTIFVLIYLLLFDRKKK